MANISGSAGDTITVTDSSGNVVATTTATSSFGNVVFSTESLTSGETYTITTSSGSSATATATEEGTNNGPGVGGIGGFPGGGFVGDGHQFGVNLTYEVQPSPDGLTQAFVIGVKLQ